MKENIKAKVAMYIFSLSRKQIVLIADLLGQFADVSVRESSFPLMENRLVNGLVIFLIVPKAIISSK